MSLTSFLQLIVRALHDADIPFMLTGSLAAAYYGAARATQDVDVVIESAPENLKQFVKAVGAAGCYVDLDTALSALQTGGQFNVVEPTTGWKADLIVRRTRPFSVSEFDRRQHRELLGIEIGLTTLEDLIIAKLEWSEMGDSELQRRDIRELVDLAGDAIDHSYLDLWIDALKLRAAWDRVSTGR